MCGSWLACDVGASVDQLHRGDAIAGKPAPTKAISQTSQPGDSHPIEAPTQYPSSIGRHPARSYT
ncbi:hypothetical protein GDV60_17495 [Pseudomonas sp. DTU12.1]|nr:hypothetical protein GDV60_17495 [Pseudomonas sp. DTU12.1]